MSVRRRKKNRLNLWGFLAVLVSCGLMTGVCLVASVIILRNQLPTIGLQIAGFEDEGETDAIFVQTDSNTVISQIVAPTQPADFQISAQGVGSEVLNNNTQLNLSVGNDVQGQQIAEIRTTESDLLQICQQRSPLCRAEGLTEGGYSIRNVRIDLKPGGAILEGDFTLEGLNVWQRAGLVFQVNDSGNRLVVRGVDMGGRLFSSPPQDLAALVTQAELAVNNAVQQIVLTAENQQYTLDQIAISETELTVFLR